MAIFKAPRITTSQRMGLVLEQSEIVYDVTQNLFYGGDGLTMGGKPMGSGQSEKDVIQLTEQHILNKSVELSRAPTFPGTVTLVPVGGIPQLNGVDFQVSGNVVSWNGLGLDNFLEEEEVLIIQY